MHYQKTIYEMVVNAKNRVRTEASPKADLRKSKMTKAKRPWQNMTSYCSPKANMKGALAAKSLDFDTILRQQKNAR